MPKKDDFQRLIKVGTAHLKKNDPKLKDLLQKLGPIEVNYPIGEPPFKALSKAIIYQQLATAAATNIFGRFKKLDPPKKYPRPEILIKMSDEKFRTAGVSRQKAGYLRDLSQKSLDGALNARRFPKMSDEEVMAVLTQVKGVGEWTAQMYLIFTLGRPDVLPTGDLGVQEAAKRVYGLRKRPSPERFLKLAKPWRPYATVASLALWRLLDGPV